jgi:hypothetical protein
MNKRFGLAAFRLLLGTTVLVAIAVQFIQGQSRSGFSAANFFSYFTIESNLLAAAIFIITGGAILGGIKLRRRSLIRGAAVLYMTITGIVYALLLSGISAELGLTLPWVNMVLHYLMPIAVLLDWFIDPPERRVSFKSGLTWTFFPLAYLIYSLIRGHNSGWYPYPFLNPAEDGYIGVVAISVGILAVTVGLIWLITKISGRNDKSTNARTKK